MGLTMGVEIAESMGIRIPLIERAVNLCAKPTRLYFPLEPRYLT